MTRRPSTRAAFTLVELLVVISIIAILMGLLLPAVQKIRGIGPRTKAVAEVEQLGIAAKSFYGEFKFYPPTFFRLPLTPPPSAGATGPLEDASFLVLKRMFPRWNPALNGSGQIVWDPSIAPFAGQTLAGDQSLVLFLGGPSRTGWAIDAPLAPSPTAVGKKVPFFDFEEKRVVGGHYLDPWGINYVYFGSQDGGNYAITPVGSVSPFFVAVGKPVNQGGCQIISAGENKAFGPGGAWVPGSGAYVTGQPGGDDIGNFNGGKMLGVN